uniref:Nucleolar 27S pre-rRNA processing Urb2/Npa2 C-terminal domain-containing protein n=1 Tax=Romanomermis culicivorax TaxID=13658 RepID=A0A915I273_ROMCU
MSEDHLASRRLLEDCFSSNLNGSCDANTWKKFKFKFYDLSYNGAIDFGRILFVKCSELGSSSNEDSAAVFDQLCFIVDMYFDSIDYVRYFNFLPSFAAFFDENLSKIIEKLTESPRLSIIFSILSLKCVKFKQFCDFYGSRCENLHLKSIIKSGLKALAPSVDKRLLEFSKLILSSGTKNGEILDDYNLEHICELDVCQNQFCMDTYRILCYVKNLPFIMNLILEDESRTRKLFEFCLRSIESDAKQKVLDLLTNQANWKSTDAFGHNIIGIFFDFCANFVDKAFVFGSDVGLWLRNFYVANNELNFKTAQKILRKFFRHFGEKNEIWRGKIQSLDMIRSFDVFLDFLTRVPYEILNETSKFLLFSLNSILLKIFDMCELDVDTKKMLIHKIVNILLFSTHKSNFLTEFDVVFEKLCELKFDADAFIEILSKIDYTFYEKLLDRLIIDQGEENHAFLIKVLKIGEKFDQCREKIDTLVSNVLKRNSKRWSIVLPLFLPIFISRNPLSSKLFGKICKHIIESMVNENFALYITFIVENFDRVSGIYPNIKQILLSNLRQSSSTILRQNSQILVSCAAKIFNHLTIDDVKFVFDELEHEKLLLILDIFVNCVENLPGDEEFSPIIKSLKRSLSSTLKSAPFNITLSTKNWQMTEDTLHICNDLCKERRKVRLLNVKAVNNIFGILYAINYDSIQVENLHIFTLVCDILRHLLKPKSTYVVNSAHIFLHIWINIQKSSIKWIHDEPDNRQISNLVSKFCSVLIFGAKKFSTDFCKIAPYLVAEFVLNLKNYPLKKRQLDYFLPYIFEFLDICDKYASAMLATNLDDGSKEVFRMIFDEYTKFHKFRMFT